MALIKRVSLFIQQFNSNFLILRIKREAKSDWTCPGALRLDRKIKGTRTRLQKRPPSPWPTFCWLLLVAIIFPILKERSSQPSSLTVKSDCICYVVPYESTHNWLTLPPAALFRVNDFWFKFNVLDSDGPLRALLHAMAGFLRLITEFVVWNLQKKYLIALTLREL